MSSVRARAVTVALAAGLVVAAVAATGIGAYSIGAGDVVRSIATRIGVIDRPLPEIAESVLWNVRMPRVALALVVGAALGAAGTLAQGTFANPLAEPGIIGVASGAALGAALAIVTGFDRLGGWSLAVAGFVGGMGAVAMAYSSARADGRTETVTIVLTGIAINAGAGALIGLLASLASDAQLRGITSWSLGSVAQATWPKVAVVTPIVVVGGWWARRRARALDILGLGEGPARSLGVAVDRLHLEMMVTIAALTAAAVAVSGILVFVGLVVPHLARMAVGPGHRSLVPTATLGGALAVVVCDLVARTAVAPAELPLGVITGLLGSPVFFVLLRTTRRQRGMWA